MNRRGDHSEGDEADSAAAVAATAAETGEAAADSETAEVQADSETGEVHTKPQIRNNPFFRFLYFLSILAAPLFAKPLSIVAGSGLRSQLEHTADLLKVLQTLKLF